MPRPSWPLLLFNNLVLLSSFYRTIIKAPVTDSAVVTVQSCKSHSIYLEWLYRIPRKAWLMTVCCEHLCSDLLRIRRHRYIQGFRKQTHTVTFTCILLPSPHPPSLPPSLSHNIIIFSLCVIMPSSIYVVGLRQGFRWGFQVATERECSSAA